MQILKFGLTKLKVLLILSLLVVTSCGLPSGQETTSDIEELITTLDDYCHQGQVDNQGMCNSLRGKLTKVQDDLNSGKEDKAIKELQIFIKNVNTQRGKHITVETADQLIEMAEQLIAQLQ